MSEKRPHVVRCHFTVSLDGHPVYILDSVLKELSVVIVWAKRNLGLGDGCNFSLEAMLPHADTISCELPEFTDAS